MAKTRTNNRIIEAVRDIPDIARREKWVFTLDRDEGALFYSKPVIPKGSLLYYMNDEFSIYLDKDFKPNGVFVEAWRVNFVEHHPDLGRISKKIFSSTNKRVEEVNPHTKRPETEVSLFREFFEKTMISETVTIPTNA